MASRDNLPKIVRDVQDIVNELYNEFEATKEPITDDNHALHKLCAKLEFLLTSSTKEKSVLGGRKNYWHWMFSCLRHARGLNEGLRYVQANKEVRSSKGKGRALIRYCLVHQTLADSFQNCIMNSSLTSQHFSETSVLLNQVHASAFVTSLYDLNAVNFDLNSKGYDLDAGWPTFASKRASGNGDQWAVQSHVGSLGSLTSASVVMDHPQIGRLHNGSGSSGPSSVDQRIEDLVLELDQSDHKICEQQALIQQLEMKAESLETSTGEKEEILAAVISDVETKNRHLHQAMSNMTSEFEARDFQWKEKYGEMSKQKNDLENAHSKLVLKVQQLENDKHNLEEMVSQQMSRFTSSFTSNSSPPSTILTPVTSTPNYEGVDNGKPLKNDDDVTQNKEFIEIQSELEALKRTCDHYEQRLAENAANLSKIAELQARISENEEMATILSENEKRAAAEEATTSILGKIVPHLFQDGVLPIDTPDQVECIVNHIAMLSHSRKTEEKLQTASLMDTNSKQQMEIDNLRAENDRLMIDRDTALVEVTQTKQKFADLLTQVEDFKLQLESSRTSSSSRINELEEQLHLSDEKSSALQRHHVEMLADLQVVQESLKRAETETENEKQKCVTLEEELKSKESEWLKEKSDIETQMEEEKLENEFYLEEIHSEMARYASMHKAIDRDLEVEKARRSSAEGELNVAKSTIASFTTKLEETTEKLFLTGDAHLQMKSEMDGLRLKYETSLSEISNALNEEKKARREEMEKMQMVEEKLGQVLHGTYQLLSETRDKDSTEEMHLKNEENFTSQYMSDISQLCVELQHTALKYQVLTDDLQERESETRMLRDQMGCDKDVYSDEIRNLEDEKKELQATIEIQEITIKDVSDKFTLIQEENATHLNAIEVLVAKNSNLSVEMDTVKSGNLSLASELAEAASKVGEYQSMVEVQTADILSLKERITELLFDKDNLWKDSENLRQQLSDLDVSTNQDDLDKSEAVDWIADDDVTMCQSCDQKFSITLRKHHCRICGKIFCRNCSDNWVTRNEKQLRCCNTCYADENPGAASPSKSTTRSVDHGRTDTVIDIQAANDSILSAVAASNSYEELTPEELSQTDEDPTPFNEGKTPDKSMYQSLTGMFTRPLSSSLKVLDVKNEDTVIIAARSEVRLPILIENEGLKLKWSISSNRDINFKLCFSLPEGEEIHELVPLRRINSHLEAFKGHLVARKCGIYTIVLDNTYSKLTAKEVTYKLDVTRNINFEA